jgi:hypothetical protein
MKLGNVYASYCGIGELTIEQDEMSISSVNSMNANK